jgi:beta-phosphoglucomutase-like phosphatase (HAD superfamily)
MHVSIASSADRDQLKAYEKIANIGDLIEESSTADDAKRSKPHPDIFEATLKKLGLPSSEVLALGDTPYDAEAAGKAEIWTVGVLTGGWSEEELFRLVVSKSIRMLQTSLRTLQTARLRASLDVHSKADGQVQLPSNDVLSKAATGFDETWHPGLVLRWGLYS